DPAHREADDDRQQRRQRGDEQRVAKDVGVAAEAREVVETVRLGGAGLRIADAQRGLDEESDRVEDQHRRDAGDQKADEPTTERELHKPMIEFHSFTNTGWLAT